jgi:hypothetical protein
MRLVAVLLVLGGLVCVVVGAVVANTAITVSVGARPFSCGRVISPKDPRDLVPKHVQIPPLFETAHDRCLDERSNKSSTAAVLLVAGAVLEIAGIAMSARTRRTRRRTLLRTS